MRTFPLSVFLLCLCFLLNQKGAEGKPLLPTPNQRYRSSQFSSTPSEVIGDSKLAQPEDSDEIDENSSSRPEDTSDSTPEDDNAGTFQTSEERSAPKNSFDSSNSAGVQFMITNKMKSTLINDLGYLSSEVEEMEPQIAAVVIEKSLRRPKRGMPASWRKNANIQKSGNTFSFLKDLKSSLERTWKAHQANAQILLPIMLISSAVFLQRDTIMYLLESFIQSLKEAKYKFLHSSGNDDSDGQPRRSKLFSFFGLPRSSTKSREEEASIDLKGYDKVVRDSLWNHFKTMK